MLSLNSNCKKNWQLEREMMAPFNVILNSFNNKTFWTFMFIADILETGFKLKYQKHFWDLKMYFYHFIIFVEKSMVVVALLGMTLSV